MGERDTSSCYPDGHEITFVEGVDPAGDGNYYVEGSIVDIEGCENEVFPMFRESPENSECKELAAKLWEGFKSLSRTEDQRGGQEPVILSHEGADFMISEQNMDGEIESPQITIETGEVGIIIGKEGEEYKIYLTTGTRLDEGELKEILNCLMEVIRSKQRIQRRKYVVRRKMRASLQ
jgi:hypothetical protein